MKDIKMENIMAKMKVMHPNLPEQKIRDIIKEGCKNMNHQIKLGKDIQMKARKNSILFQVYKPHSNQ